MKLKNKVIAFAMTTVVAFTTFVSSFYATEPEPLNEEGAVYSEVNVAIKDEIDNYAMNLQCKLVKDGKEIATWVSENGYVSLKNIPWGDYKVNVTNLSNNYEKDGDWTISLAKNGKTNPMFILKISKADTKSLRVDKLNKADNSFVEGATLQLLDEEGTVVDEWDTANKAYYIEGLPVGHTYTVHEKTVPEGYIGGKDEKVVISKTDVTDSTVNGADYYVTIYNTKLIDVAVEKREATSKDFVEGAELKIYKYKEEASDLSKIEDINLDDWTFVEEWTTDDKAHTVKNLEPGFIYAVLETKVPNGFVKMGYDEVFYLDYDGKIKQKNLSNEEGKNVLILNVKKGDVIVNKKDSESNELIEGALFRLLDENKNTLEEWTSTKDGHVLQYAQPDVHYILHEAQAPDRYEVGEDIEFYYTVNTTDKPGEITIFVKENDTFKKLEKNEIDVYNKKLPQVRYEVVVTKKDATSKDIIKGAQFEVTTKENDKEVTVDAWTSSDEGHKLSLLPDVVYTLKEIQAPEGYVKDKDIDFTIKEKPYSYEVWTTTPDSKPNDLKKLRGHEIVVENRRTLVLVKKLDSNKTFLAGAKLEIKDANGKVVSQFTTARKEQEIEKLPFGKYTLHEVQAPTGYKVAKDVPFEVTDKTVIVEMIDEIDASKEIEIKKYDVRNNFVEGAELAIKDKDGKEIARWTTKKEAYKVTLLPGDYTLTEVKAPSGYVKADDVKFTVYASKMIRDDVIMRDDYTKVEIKKCEEGTERMLYGAKLELIDEDGDVIETWSSGGIKTFTKLAHGKYTLHEVQAPVGYELASDITFEVTDKKETVSIKMYDKKKVEQINVNNEVKPLTAPKQVEVKSVQPAPERVQTGDENNSIAILVIVMISLVASIIFAIKKIRK